MSKNVLQKIFNGSTFDEIHPITKASNVYTSNGQSVEDMVRDRLGYAVTTSNSPNPALIAEFTPEIKELKAGLRITIKLHAAKTGATYLNVDYLGEKRIKTQNGGDPMLSVGGVYTLVYDGTSFILQGEGGDYLDATVAAVSADIKAGKSAYVNGKKIDGNAGVFKFDFYTNKVFDKPGAAHFFSLSDYASLTSVVVALTSNNAPLAIYAKNYGNAYSYLNPNGLVGISAYSGGAQEVVVTSGSTSSVTMNVYITGTAK